MIILLVVLLSMATSLGLGLLRLARQTFAYNWLITAGSALIVWVMAILSRLSLPTSITLGVWQPSVIFTESPVFVLDQMSWPLIVALATLNLSVVLVGGREAARAGWQRWASLPAFTALGVLAVSAGNPLSLIMIWVGLDFLELITHLSYIGNERQRQQALVITAVRLTGVFLVLAASIYSASDGVPLRFERLGRSAVPLILLAAYLRLGLYPLTPPLFADRSLRRSLGTVTRLVGAASALILPIRSSAALQTVGMEGGWLAFWWGLTGLLALYAGLAWFFSEDELDGRPGWILGLASLSIAGAIGGMVNASLIWAIALVLSGSLLFLADVRQRASRWIVTLGGIGLTMLPFTPSWEGVRILMAPFHSAQVFYFLAIVFFLSGYLIKSIRLIGDHPAGEAWIEVFYLMGLVLFPLTHIGLGVFRSGPTPSGSLIGWIGGFAALSLSVVAMYWRRRGGTIPQWMTSLLDLIFSLRWLSGFLKVVYGFLDAVINFASQILDGEGGVLWAILWIVIVVTFLIVAV